MKKALVAIVSVIYVVSIIIVAFLGVRAEILSTLIDTPVEKILLDDLSSEDKLVGGEYTYYNDATQTHRVYSEYSRPKDEEIGENGKKDGIIWNVYEEGEEEPDKYDYSIKIWDLNTIYDDASWRDGEGKFKIFAHVYPEDATNQNIVYSVSGATEEYPVTIDKEGVISLPKAENIGMFDVIMSAADASLVMAKISVTVRNYRS